MAQVPYNPVSNVPVSGEGVSGPRIATPSEAFGLNISQAISRLGQVSEHAGNELFTRAIAMQEVQNQAEARDADTQYMIKAGDLYTEFESLKGIDAVRAQDKYRQDLVEIRKQIRGSLSNPMVQKLYDAQTQSTMGRSIFSGARHAATELKQFNVKTAESQMFLDGQTVEDNPNDDLLFQQKLQRTRQNAAEIADSQGLRGPSEQALHLKASSQLWARRIMGLSRTDPEAAARMLDANKTQLTESDYLKVDGTVRNQSRAIGSVNIANSVFENGLGDDNKPQKSLEVMEREARDLAKKMYPDDPVLEKQAVSALNGRWNQYNRAKRYEKIDNQQIVAEGIQAGVENVQQLRANPKVAAAIDALPHSEQNKIPAQINSYNTARDRNDNLKQFDIAKGLANNDLVAFLEEDFTDKDKWKLSQQQINQLHDLQRKLTKDSTKDPRVDKAMRWMREGMAARLDTLGVLYPTQSNKEDRAYLAGTVQSALESWQDAHKRAPTQKEFMEQIAPYVLRTVTTPAWFGYTTTDTPIYNAPIPDTDMGRNFKAAAKKKAMIEGQPEPSDREMQQLWTRMQFMKLYGPVGSKAEAKDQSRAK